MPPVRRRGPTLAEMLRARDTGSGYASTRAGDPFRLVSPSAPTTSPEPTDEELMEMEEQARATGLPPSGPRGASPVGQTVSPNVFASNERLGLPPDAVSVEGATTNDPAAITGSRGPDYYKNVQSQLEMMMRQVPQWRDKPITKDQYGNIIDPAGTKIDISNDDEVASYMSSVADITKREPSFKAMHDSFVMKAVESDPSSPTYLKFTPEVEKKYGGIPGVDLATLNMSEKLLLKRLGVPFPRRSRQRR